MSRFDRPVTAVVAGTLVAFASMSSVFAQAPAGQPATQPTSRPAPSAFGGGVGNYLQQKLADARIELAASALNRGQPVKGVLRLPAAAGDLSNAKLNVHVYDTLGRVLISEVRALPAGATKDAIPFEISVPNIIAQRHTIKLGITGADGQTDARRVASADVLYRFPTAWDDYICTMWQRHNMKRVPYLQEMYLTGSQLNGTSSLIAQDWVNANYRYYVESTGNWAYSSYHIHHDKLPKTYWFTVAKERYKADPTNLRHLEREPCLSNHVIRDRLDRQFTAVAQLHRDYVPLYYTVADEPGIGDQAAPFDFCFGPDCLEGFRVWLQERYPSLEALNEQWGSDYKDWKDVRGATTNEIFARKDDNFSAWSDHKDFMDTVLIGAYDLAKKAVRRTDPNGRIGMGGGQGPAAVGGWDWWKISQTMDVMEAYYIGNNYELMRSFNPNLIPFHCSFGGGSDAEKHLIWYLFNHGDRGLVVWDDKSDYVDDYGNYSETAKKAREIYKELSGGIGKYRIASKRTDDAIALYESQPNLRVHWALEVRPEGERWINRGSSAERTQSRYFRLRQSWATVIEDNGLQYRFMAPQQVKADLKPYDPATGTGFRVLILPEILALSADEVAAIRAFVDAGGTVIADKLPGEFDAHGKRLPASPLAEMFAKGGRAILLNQDMHPYLQTRILPDNSEVPVREQIGKLLRDALGDARVTPEVLDPEGKGVTGVETTLWRNGKAEMISLHRNPLLRVNELGPQEYKSNAKFETPVKLIVRRNEPRAWYNARSGESLGTSKEVSVELKPFEPVILTSLPAAANAFTATVEREQLKITPGTADVEHSVYHLDYVGPDGNERLVYRSNVACGAKGGAFAVPLARNDAKGDWTIKIREIATGAEKSVSFKHE